MAVHISNLHHCGETEPRYLEIQQGQHEQSSKITLKHKNSLLWTLDLNNF